MKTTTKRSGLRGVKLLITAASIAVTLGGWAALASQEAAQSRAVTAASAPNPAPNADPPASSRSLAAPRALRRVTALPPIAITRSSR